MAMTFYNNKLNESLKFRVDANGVNASVLEARLILRTKNTNSIIFGKVNETGQCIFDLPKLESFKKGEKGRIQFELISEDSYFKVWENEFEIQSKGEVKVTEQVETKKKPGAGILATLEEDPTKTNPNAETDPVTTGPVVENCKDCEEASENLDEVEEEVKKLGGTPAPIEESKTVLDKIATDIKAVYDKHYHGGKTTSFHDFINRK